MRIAAVSLCALALACSGPAAVAGGDSDIQGGASDPHHAAVGMVWTEGNFFYSGTLIAPQVVLTSARAVQRRVRSFYTGPGAAMSTAGVPAGMVRYDVIAQAANPGFSWYGCPNWTGDTGLLYLAEPVHGIAPVPLASTPPGAGRTCTTVGFGYHLNGDGTTTRKEKRSATVQIVAASVGGTLGASWVDGIPDGGDSGGPLLCGGRVAATASCFTDGEAPDHVIESFARADLQASWIAQTIDGWSKNPPRPAAMRAVRVAVGTFGSCALIEGGDLRCWGVNSDGDLGNGTTDHGDVPRSVLGFGAGTMDLSMAYRTGCARAVEGDVRCWGWGEYGQLGDGSKEKINPIPRTVLGAGPGALAQGPYDACSADPDGVRCWGYTYGAPTLVWGVPGPVRAMAIAAFSFYALLDDGRVLSWGDAVALGRSTSDPWAPGEVGLARPARAVAAAADRACALLDDGTVQCWGGAEARPVATVPGLARTNALAVGYQHACALIEGGEVRCWGANDHGQLGDGTTNPSGVPVAVKLAGKATAIATMESHTCAVLGGGEVQCWGANKHGQVNDPTYLDALEPFTVRF